MLKHNVIFDDFIYTFDKSVHVCAYTRRRDDKLERVCSHYRSRPSR